MKAFVWSDRFVTGFATVDSQHQYLFELVNRVGTLLLDPDPAQPAEIEGVFKELATYANTHFKDEEHLMQTLGVDAEHQRHHVKTHRDFIEQVKSMWQQRTTMNAPAETLHGFLVAWLTYHILGEDQEMAREIVRIQGGMPPAEAHQLASEGARFSQAYSDCPICIPQRASMLTGGSAAHSQRPYNSLERLPVDAQTSLPGLLTRQAYKDIGGVGGALARHAEATIDRIGSERIGIVRELFRNLVTAEGTDDSSTNACMADPCKFDARLRPYPIAGDTSRRIPAANAMAGMWNFPLAL